MTQVSQEFLGNGIITPLQRLGGNDFVVSSGVALVRSTISQIIGTSVGELKWRPRFGLSLFKHKNKINNSDLEVLISREIQSGILKYEPRVNTINISVTRSGSNFIAKITWNLIDHNTPENKSC